MSGFNANIKVASSDFEVKQQFSKIPPRREGLGSIFNVNEPTPKVQHVRNDGKLGIAFNNKMLLPADFMDIVIKSKLRALEDKDGPALIEILSEPGEESSQLDLDWEIIEFSEKGLDFKLVYKNPLEVSQNDEPDTIRVRLNLGNFTDEYGQPMADGTEMQVKMPR